MKNRKGFTLIEMLVVIAIIAVLVAIVIPTVSTSTTKAKAATDAANLHSIYGLANSTLVGGKVEPTVEELKKSSVDCVSFPNAKLKIAYAEPTFVTIAFVDGSKYYDMDYFSEVAATGESTRTPDNPAPDATWYSISN